MDATIDFKTMNFMQFYTVLDGLKTGNARLNFLKDAKDGNYNFLMEQQPDAIIQRFYNKNINVRDFITTFIECFDKVILCREASYRNKVYMTIVDCLIMDLQDVITINDVRTSVFLRLVLNEAFTQGLRPAILYPKENLDKLMVMDIVYSDHKEYIVKPNAPLFNQNKSCYSSDDE